MFTLTFKGMAPGQYGIKRAKENTAYWYTLIAKKPLVAPTTLKRIPTKKGIHCGAGNINILSFTNGTFKGTVHAKLEGYGTTGTLDGKFTVKLATMQVGKREA